jgi:EAL and modified HD-GYP domain-containing signal transduction protein
MSGWLSRLIGRGGDTAAPLSPRPALASAAPRPATPPPPSTAARAVAEAPLPVARRPLIDREGRLAGFEFPLPELLHRRLAQGADDTVLGAHVSAWIAATRPVAQSGRVALLALPEALSSQWLARPALLSQLKGQWLVLARGAFDASLTPSLDALRATGAVLGAAQSPQRGAGFVRIDDAGAGRAATLAAIAACRSAAPRARIVTSGMADVDDVEAVLAAGADLATGHHDRQGAPRGAVPLPPAMARVTRLLNQVLQDADLADIAAELRSDVSLSYELLRHANSPLLGLPRQVDATDQAVMLLGRDAIYRWLCARLLAALPGRATARALQEIALARALLFERLAGTVGAPASTLYTMGLLSLLDVMVPMPMAEALAPLNLPKELRAALAERSGPWAPLVAMAADLERGDLAAAERHAGRFGGLQAVLAANDSAWQAAGQAASVLWAKA